MSGASVWGRFCRSRLAVVALLYLAGVAAVGASAPLLSGEAGLVGPGPTATNLRNRLAGPESRHLLGTDELGRDVLARMIHGARVSLTVALVATAAAVVVGTLLGALAGYFGRGVDWAISRLIEIFLCFPLLFLVLGIVALFRPSLWTVVVALALTSWTTQARLMRAEVLRIRDLDYAEAARATGAGHTRILLRHLVPNAIAPILVSASFGVADAVLAESALSFLGLGVQVPMPSWGGILSSAREHAGQAWWLVVFPGLAIFLTVIAFNLVGDRLREAMDPRRDWRMES